MEKIISEATGLLDRMKALNYWEYRYQDEDTKKQYDTLYQALRAFVADPEYVVNPE